MIQSLIFNGKNLREFGVLISGVKTYGAPSRIVQYEQVKGRNGNLLIDDGVYENITVSYQGMINDNFAANMEGLRNFLLSTKGYARLEDSYSPETYRMACLSNAIDVDVAGYGNTNGQFDLEFNCKPQRFIKQGEIAITMTASGTVYNPTLFDSLPFIRAYGTGTLTINSTQITITGSNPYVDINCELQDVSYITQNMNNYVTISPYDFPKFVPGDNTITLGAGITQVIITPHWWHL